MICEFLTTGKKGLAVSKAIAIATVIIAAFPDSWQHTLFKRNLKTLLFPRYRR